MEALHLAVCHGKCPPNYQDGSVSGVTSLAGLHESSSLNFLNFFIKLFFFFSVSCLVYHRTRLAACVEVVNVSLLGF